MSKVIPPTPIRASDYEAIETALLDSARGRWFLNEYSRRNRTADTQMLLEAITKLEAAVIQPGAAPGGDRIRRDLIEMSEAIARTRREIAAITSQDEDSRLITATEELDAIVEATEKATSDILEAAEDVQEAAWLLREKGTEEDICNRLDERATDIYTACSFQDITGQRTSKVVEILHYLEKRVNSMIDIWGLDDLELRLDDVEDNRPDAHLLNGPQLHGKGLEQDDIDDMIGFRELEDGEEGVIDSEAREVHEEAAAAISEELQTGAPVQQNASAAVPETATAPEPADAFDHDLLVDPASSPIGQPVPQTASPGTDMADVPTLVPNGQAPGPAEMTDTVTAEDFQRPDDLTIGELDEPKKAALFS